MKCWIKDCKVCKNEGWFKYMFQIPFKEFHTNIHWIELIIFALIVIALGFWLKWWSIPVDLLIFYFLNNYLNGWGALVMRGDYEEKKHKTKCVAGNENCLVCDKDGNFMIDGKMRF